MSSSAADSLEPYFDMTGPVLTHLQHVTTVTGQPQAHEAQTSGTPEVRYDAPRRPAPRLGHPQLASGQHHLPVLSIFAPSSAVPLWTSRIPLEEGR